MAWKLAASLLLAAIVLGGWYFRGWLTVYRIILSEWLHRRLTTPEQRREERMARLATMDPEMKAAMARDLQKMKERREI